MARSIHATQKHLKRERLFAASDGVSWGPDATELEASHIKKLLFKDNEGWRRDAEKKKAPGIAQLKLKERKIVRTLFKKRAPKPANPTEPKSEVK